MGVYSTALSSLIQSIAMSFDDCVVCTPSAAGTTNTALCNTLLRANDYYNGMDLHFYSGTFKDLTREVTGFVTTNYVLTFLPAVLSNTAAIDLFQLHKKYTYAQYKGAINRAIEMGKTEYLLNKIDDSLIQVADTYSYAIPTTFHYISEAWVSDEDTHTLFETPIDKSRWRIVRDAVAPTIVFEDEYAAGCHFRLIGQSWQSALSVDASVCYLPPEYVIQTARALLITQRPEYEKQMNVALAIASNERKMMCVPATPGSRAVWEL
jgi:hypothetical protein